MKLVPARKLHVYEILDLNYVARALSVGEYLWLDVLYVLYFCVCTF